MYFQGVRWAGYHGTTGVNPPRTDAEIIRLVQRGERDAFGDLVTRYMHRAYYAALALVGSHDDALDMSQDAFVRAFHARRTIDPERPFFPWYYQIVRRLCFNLTRDRRNREAKLREARPWLVVDSRVHQDERSPERRVETSELREQVETAMDELSNHDREILVLKDFQDLKYREIAEMLDIPMGTVMSRLYSARRHLADKLRGVM